MLLIVALNWRLNWHSVVGKGDAKLTNVYKPTKYDLDEYLKQLYTKYLVLLLSLLQVSASTTY
jgi:hypothetical protein